MPILLTLLLPLLPLLPPDQLAVQGRLNAPGGNTVDGNYGIQVRLYDEEFSGALLLERQFASVTVVDGVFVLTLDAISGALADGPRWMEIAVGGEPPLPRSLLTPVPYAHVATRSLDLSCTGCLETGHLADGAVTASKLGEICAEGEVLKFLNGSWVCGSTYWNGSPNGDVVLPAGRVGIGTATPAVALDIAGAIKIGTQGPCGPDEEGALRYNAAEKNMEFCDALSWKPLYAPPADGQTKASAAASCQGILVGGYSVGDGPYWLDPTGGAKNDAFQTWCDMTTDGGGWTLLGTISGADANAWNTQGGLWSNYVEIGAVTGPFGGDFKSGAWGSLPLKEVLWERRYDGTLRGAVRIAKACLFGRTTFRDLFVGYDTSLLCPISDLTVVKAPTDAAGVSDISYIEGGSNGLGGTGTNGWCWNGGDTDSNIFQGHTGWNQVGYSTCLAAGHLGYIGIFSNSSSQYHNWDIDTTNWLNSGDPTRTAVSFFGR